MALPSEDLYTYYPPERKKKPVSSILPSEDLYTSYPPERIDTVALNPAQRVMPDISAMPIHTPSLVDGNWLDELLGGLDSFTIWLSHLFSDPLPTIALVTGSLFGGMSAGSLIMLILKFTAALSGGTRTRRTYGEGTWKEFSIPEKGHKDFIAYLIEQGIKLRAGKVIDGRYHFTVAAYHLGVFQRAAGAYARSEDNA